MKYVDKVPNVYEVVEIKLDNIEELKKLFTIGRVEFFENDNPYFKTSPEEKNYYIGVEIGAFQFELGYWYMIIGEYLVKSNKGGIQMLSKTELNKKYKLAK